MEFTKEQIVEIRSKIYDVMCSNCDGKECNHKFNGNYQDIGCDLFETIAERLTCEEGGRCSDPRNGYDDDEDIVTGRDEYTCLSAECMYGKITADGRPNTYWEPGWEEHTCQKGHDCWRSRDCLCCRDFYPSKNFHEFTQTEVSDESTKKIYDKCIESISDIINTANLLYWENNGR